jgi:two-component system, chemotaxis family, chemotaxis protein CheY
MWRTIKMTFKILLAEDDEVTQQIVRSLLSGISAIDLTVTDDGRQALEAALKQPYDLMIFDQNMPHINGDRVIRHLRAGNSCNRDTRVIRFTAEAEALSQPASGCHSDIIMPKPIRGADFIGVIKGIMANGSQARENSIL